MQIKYVFDPDKRPAFPMQSGSFEPKGNSDVVAAAAAARLEISQMLPSVCQVLATANQQRKLEATAFLATPDLVVTCMHVLRPYVTLRQQAIAIKTPISIALPDADGRAYIEIPVMAVAGGQNDIAVLRLKRPASVTPLRLSDQKVGVAELVVATGYPGKVTPGNEAAAATVFGPGGLWRLHVSPGEAWPAGEYGGHDCSTLGGHSGCPVISLATYSVIAMHGGTGGLRHLSYPASQIKAVLQQLSF